MRHVQLVIGVILVIKGISDCIALPAALSALQLGTAYSAGEATGLVIGAMAVLAGGVILVLKNWRAPRTIETGAPTS